MSLLLDALKKAADDKQKASQGDIDGGAKDSSVTVSDVRRDTAQPNRTQDHEIPANIVSADQLETGLPETGLEQQAINNETSDNEELTLDIIEDDEPALEVADETVQGTRKGPPIVNNIEGDSPVETMYGSSSGPPVAGSNNVVSDEALSLLINKTNHEVKNSKRNIFITVSLLGMAVLSAGGVYYYFDMQAEMASLQSKHNIAMMAMRAKTGGNDTVEESEIIRSFVNKAEPEENIKLAKKRIAEDKRSNSADARQSKKKNQTQTKAVNDIRTAQKAPGVLSIQRTNKSDPIGDKLDDAWLAYEDARYDDAERLYAGVLRSEKNNRDAMLGLAAIAINNNEPVQARKYYQKLLRLDPRDPVAIAGITSMNTGGDEAEADESYLLNMLEKNPKAAQLNSALANIYAQKGEWKTAQKYYFNAWEQDSENADYLFNMAVSLDQLGKPKQALKFYNESLLRSENKLVGFSRAAVQQRIKVLGEK